MRLSITLSFLLVAASGSAQKVSEFLPDLIATVKTFNDARTDARRDSLSERINAGLHLVLQADDAFKADLTSLPLSRVDAPDGKFRLITWNVPYEDGTFSFHGLLAVQDENREVVHELHDHDTHPTLPLTKKLAPANWFGALYYTVIPNTIGKRTYYTLLGWRGHSLIETRKVIDVLTFNGPTPTFGATIFDDGKLKHSRKIFGYNAQGSMSLKYDAPNKAIVFNHLAPIQQEFAGKPELLGADLSFDAYVWYRNEWRFLRDVDARNMDLTRPSKRPPPAPGKP